MEEDFRIWGRIEHAAPMEYVVIVTKIPETGNPAGLQTLTATCETKDDANRALQVLMVKMGHSIRAEGGQVTDTDINGI